MRIVWGDITDPDRLRRALDGVDAVIHLAAIIPAAADRVPELARKVNVDAHPQSDRPNGGLGDREAAGLRVVDGHLR